MQIVKIIMPRELDVSGVHVTLDDGREVQISGDGHVLVKAGYLCEYEFRLPDVGTVADACTAKYGRGSESDSGHGEVDIPVPFVHRH